MDCFSQGILVETVLAYLKLFPQPAKSTVLPKKTKKLAKKHGQQRYCKGLIHCECLGNGIPDKNLEFNTVNSTKETCKVGYQRMTER